MEAKQNAQANESASGQNEESLALEQAEEKTQEQFDNLKAELEELKDKHLRLYAEFENYKKKVQRDKEDLLMYGNESLIYELLPVIDTLEIALAHSSEFNSEVNQSLLKGVENTLREFKRILEKSGLKPIEAVGKQFDPTFHHAMSRVETSDFEDNMIVEEFRKGYILNNKVLRPALVSVSKKSQAT